MLSFLYFPVTCDTSKAVTLPNIGLPHYIGVPHRVTYPRSSMLPSVLAVANVEGVHNRTTQALFEVILLPQRSPRSCITVIASPLILRTRGDVHTSPPICPLQEKREHVFPNSSHARETCIRLPQHFSQPESQVPVLKLAGKSVPSFSKTKTPLVLEI